MVPALPEPCGRTVDQGAASPLQGGLEEQRPSKKQRPETGRFPSCARQANDITMSHILRDQFKLQRVGLEHIDQFNQLLRYVFQVTNEELQKSGYEEGELVRSKRPMLERADVFGWFNGDQLISQICMLPCKTNIHSRVYDMGGLTGVGTYPEYSGLGLMHDLFKVALNNMRERKQFISYLYPYSIPYYRRKGWEIMSDHMTFRIKDTQIPSYPDASGYVERRPVDHCDVMDTYDRFAHRTHGALIRSAWDWQEYWRWENEEERMAAVYYNESAQPTGCLIYWVVDNVFHYKEMVYLNTDARRGLWNFIGAHFSMIDAVSGHGYKNEPLAYFLQDSQIIENIEPYFMARIVDVEEFLKSFPFHVDAAAQPLHFVVSDPMCEWNNGVFSLSPQQDGTMCVGRAAEGPAVELTINTLTAMLMNYRRPSFFSNLEQLHTDANTLRVLMHLIPDEQPYFSDYF